MVSESQSPIRLEYEDPEYPVDVEYVDIEDNSAVNSVWLWHEDIKIVIINHGTAQIDSDDQSLRLLPGQAVVIGRNVMHSITKFGDDGCAYYSIAFHPDFVLGAEGTRIHEEYLRVVDSHTVKFMIFDENISWHGEIIELINSTIAANVVKSAGYELKTRSYLCMFWSILSDHCEDSDMIPDWTASSPDEQRVKDAMNYIREHYSEKIALDDIAAHIHISKSECCRCFKRSIMMTPFEYLVKYRIFKAAEMLKDPTQSLSSIAVIATMCGFNNFSYFSKQFARYMNCTPRQYRADSAAQRPSTDLISFL